MLKIASKPQRDERTNKDTAKSRGLQDARIPVY
jgi:hypothetical protein